MLIDILKQKKDATICFATGGSPKRMYEIFVERVNKQSIDISETTFVKLDEWYGIEETNENTCSTFLKKYLLDTLHTSPKQVISFNTQPKDEIKEIEKVQTFLAHNPIDFMILGLGMNGHLGLNEPSENLTLPCHKAKLHETTKTHDMASGNVLEYGFTLGMQAIFEAKQVIILVSGNKKEEAFRKFMSQEISTHTPASFLWLHQNCTALIDKEKFK